jgi:hypothetical protein
MSQARAALAGVIALWMALSVPLLAQGITERKSKTAVEPGRGKYAKIAKIKALYMQFLDQLKAATGRRQWLKLRTDARKWFAKLRATGGDAAVAGVPSPDSVPEPAGKRTSDLEKKGFNPQPEPPGRPVSDLEKKGFNPQPEPPRRKTAAGAGGATVR